jgi:hypothetical protein
MVVFLKKEAPMKNIIAALTALAIVAILALSIFTAVQTKSNENLILATAAEVEQWQMMSPRCKSEDNIPDARIKKPAQSGMDRMEILEEIDKAIRDRTGA